MQAHTLNVRNLIIISKFTPKNMNDFPRVRGLELNLCRSNGKTELKLLHFILFQWTNLKTNISRINHIKTTRMKNIRIFGRVFLSAKLLRKQNQFRIFFKFFNFARESTFSAYPASHALLQNIFGGDKFRLLSLRNTLLVNDFILSQRLLFDTKVPHSAKLNFLTRIQIPFK